MMATCNVLNSLSLQGFTENWYQTALLGSIAQLSEVVASHSINLSRRGNKAGVENTTGYFLNGLSSPGYFFGNVFPALLA